LRQPGLHYRPAIDGLRALAVLSVFIFHLNHAWMPGGFVGVDVFFVISGYLITSIILEDCRENSFKLSRFYQRRIARIFPAFFAVALATLLGASLIYSPQDLAGVGPSFSAATLSAANFKFMLQGNYFVASPDAEPFLHYWSLSVEEQFYMLLPIVFLLLYKYAPRRLPLLLATLLWGSLLACVLLTRFKPGWAFYLLPTRAWELLAGCFLAVVTMGDMARESLARDWLRWFPTFGLALVILSFGVVHEGPRFPGVWAVVPVAGAIGILIPQEGIVGLSEKLLSAAPLVWIGRRSYSLYLWHWPVFSLVDYRMYEASEPARLAAKVCLSFLAAALSFWFIENPARHFFNRPQNKVLAYCFMFFAVACCLPLGKAVHRANYVHAEASDLSRGGVVFGERNKAGSVILMGDSMASAYGTVLRDICAELGYKLTVTCVNGGDALPNLDGSPAHLWQDSLNIVSKERPDFLILACRWDAKLKADKRRLAAAVEALRPLAGHLVLLNQPPFLPENANRESIRKGTRSPFFENPGDRRRRLEFDDYVKQFNSENCQVIDLIGRFQGPQGEILFQDDKGRELYHDQAHLSAFGALLVRSDLKLAVSKSASNLHVKASP
jgi:peptidoglycan/LPS O-acetylase OafA/YrhL